MSVFMCRPFRVCATTGHGTQGFALGLYVLRFQRVVPPSQCRCDFVSIGDIPVHRISITMNNPHLTFYRNTHKSVITRRSLATGPSAEFARNRECFGRASLKKRTPITVFANEQTYWSSRPSRGSTRHVPVIEVSAALRLGNQRTCCWCQEYGYFHQTDKRQVGA